MRKIEFRAWLPKTKEMIPVYEINFCSRFINSDKYWNMEREYILEQFTGIHDCNGKKIYEGDIVMVEDFAEGTVVFLEEESIFAIDTKVNTLGFYQTYPEFLKVIGNIHN